jgi:hypothetical protein
VLPWPHAIRVGAVLVASAAEAAYIEMLLVVSVAGGAASFAVRRISQRANTLIGGELRGEWR